VTELYEAKISTEFVMNVLRQHEIELDRLIAELNIVVGNVDKLSDKIQQLVEVSHKDVIV
jgi:hypothetical protein